MHTDQREEVTAVTLMSGMAKDTVLGSECLKRKGRAGAVEEARECAQQGPA